MSIKLGPLETSDIKAKDVGWFLFILFWILAFLVGHERACKWLGLKSVLSRKDYSLDAPSKNTPTPSAPAPSDGGTSTSTSQGCHLHRS